MNAPPSSEGHKSWDDRYAIPDSAFGSEPNEFLESHAALFAPGQVVLSLGEGEGRNAIWLARRGVSVTAVDLSTVAIRRLAERAAAMHLPIDAHPADLAHWPIPPAHWDAILSIWCHIPSALRRAVHREVVAGLKPNGVFVLEAYNPKQPARGTGGPSSLDLLPTAAGLKEELAGLDFEICRELVRLVKEGRFHNGLSEVVQVTARKRA